MPIRLKLVFYLYYLVIFYLIVILFSVDGRWSSNHRANKPVNLVPPKEFKIGAVLESSEKSSQFFQAIADVNLEPNILPPGVSLHAISITHSSNPIKMMKDFCEKMIKSEVYAIVVDDGSSIEASTIAQTCDFLNIPVIGLSNRNSYLSDPHIHSVYLRTVPPYSHQVEVWIEMLLTLNYSHVVFIHSADYNGRTTFTRFQNLAEKNGINIRSVIEYEPGVTQIVDELQEADEEIQCRVYLLYAGELDAQSIFLEVARLNMTSPGYIWIVSETALQAANVPDGVIGLRLFNASNGNGHIVDSVYIIGMAIREMYPSVNITQPPSYCGDLAKNKWSTGLTFFNFLRKQFLLYGKTGRVAFDGKGDRIDADYEIINRVHGRSVTVGQYAFSQAKMKMQLWLNANSIIWPGYQTVQPLGYVRPSHLRVVTLEEEPFIFANPVSSADQCVHDSVPCAKYEPETGTERMYCCTGYCIDFLIELSKRLNFTYTLYQVGDGAYGSFEHVDGLEKPKKWTGLVGDLFYKKADIIVAPLTITPERSAYIEFSKPFKYQGITILEKKVPRRAGLASFLQPFEESLWLLVMLSVHIVALALYLLDRFSPFGRYRLPNSEVTEEDALNLSSAIWFAWGVLLNSGIGEGTPRSFSGRVLGVVWCGFAMIVIASYTANLAAFLVLERPTTSLSGINDARLRNPTDSFTYATVKESAVEMYFKRQIELKNVYAYMVGRNYKTVDEGVAAVKSAFIWDSSRLEWEAARDCDLITAAEQFGRSGYGVGLQKNSFWTDQMNSVILSMHEGGYMTDLDKKWILEPAENDNLCINGIDPVPTTLGLRNMAGVFILLGAGIVGGIALIVIEVMYKKRQVHQQRKLEAARGALERWKKLVERRRLYHESLRRLRKEQLRQEQFRQEELPDDFISRAHHYTQERTLTGSDLKTDTNKHIVSHTYAHSMPQKSESQSLDSERLTYSSPFTVERGLCEMKMEERHKAGHDSALIESSLRHSGPGKSLIVNQSSSSFEGSQNYTDKSKAGRQKEVKKNRGSETTRRRMLQRERSINLERGSTPDSLLSNINRESHVTPSPNRLIKPPHAYMYHSRPQDYFVCNYNYN